MQERNKGVTQPKWFWNKRMRTKWFCWAIKLGFLQLICKASLIFESNLKLALSIIFRELYEPYLLSFLICSSILVLKWRQVSPM